MGKKRTSLRRYVRRRSAVTTNVSHLRTGTKRKRLDTPMKRQPLLKSPFNSPLYKCSPATKKFKSTYKSFKSPYLRQFQIGKLKSPSPRKVLGKHITSRKTPARSLFDTPSKSLAPPLTHDDQFVDVWEDCADSSETVSADEFDLGEQLETDMPDTEENISWRKMHKLIPVVMRSLAEHDGMDLVMLRFFEMISDKTFPLDNISFLLWSEVIKWYDCSSTTRMRYSNETKQFWKLGWRMFGKRFVNFMGGFKSHGDTVLKMADRGHYDPLSSEINFAVPDPSVLSGFDPYKVEGERKPGVLIDVISSMSDNLKLKSACLTFDGKKLKQALTADYGDVDLLGFERGLSLKEKQQELDTCLQEVNEVIADIENMSEFTDYDKSDISETSGVSTYLLRTLQKLSVAVYDTEKLRERKEYCKQKLIERSGGESEWRKGKFVYAISAVTAFLYDIDNFIRKAEALTDMVCRYVAFFNNSKYICGDKLNLATESRYISIEQQSGPTASTRLLKQRSPEWHALRKQAKITGSTVFKALGLDGLGKQKYHFEKVICGVPESEPSVECKRAMEHGTVNEVNAIATVVGRIIPVLEPRLKFCEEGCVAVEQDDGQVFLVVSPDGSLRKDNTLDCTEVAIEIKCPVRKVHTEFPYRYLLQCLFEIKALNVDHLLYVSWGAKNTNVFRVNKNEELLSRCMKLATEIYGNEKQKKPTRLSADVRALKEDICRESKNVNVVGRFHSSISADVQNKYDEETKTKEGLVKLMENLREIYFELYNLCREKATEAVVFLLADLDRSWARNTIRSSPVVWFTKGYSLDGDTMRSIAEDVHTECHKAGIHVPCESFDGQWHGLVVRGVKGEPLTLYQLQREQWKEVEAKSKKEIVEELKCLNRTPICIENEVMSRDGENKRHFQSTNGGLRLPKYRKVTTTEQRSHDKEHRAVVSNTTLADTVSDIVRETTGIDKSVLALSNVTDEVELEAFSNNIDDGHWSEEIQRVQDIEGNSLESNVAHEADLYIDGLLEAEFQTKTKTSAPQVLESKLNSTDLECMLALLRSTKDCNKNGKWNNVSADELIEHFSNVEKVSSFLDIELRAIVRYLKKTKGLQNILESKPKKIKIDAIAASV